jgi:hypothetical protein
LLKKLDPSKTASRTYFQEPLNYQEHEGAWRQMFNSLRRDKSD